MSYRQQIIAKMARAMCDRVNGEGDYDENPARRFGWGSQAEAGLEAALKMLETPSDGMCYKGAPKFAELLFITMIQALRSEE